MARSSANKATSAAAGAGAEAANVSSGDDSAGSTSAGARAVSLAGTDRRLGRALRREIDHFVLFGVAGAVAVTGFLQLSMVVARLADTDAQAGQYAAALSLATPASLLAGSMSLVLFPAMAEAWGRGDREGFRRQGDHAMRLLVLLMVAVFGALVLVSRPLVRVVYGADYAHAADLLPWLLFAVLAISVGVGAVTSLTTRSQRGVALSSAASAVGLVVGGLVWAVVAPGEGVRGVAVGYLIGTVVGTAVPVVLVWRQDRQRWAGLMLRGAAGAALLLGLLWLEHRVGHSPFTGAEIPATAASGDSAAYSSTFTMTLDDSSRVSAWWLDPLCAIGFVVAWLAISWPDTRRLLPPLLRRR
jgi:peptidoglycan biosynthesis protein MviN/MurJ (putative lipid II flippase)